MQLFVCKKTKGMKQTSCGLCNYDSSSNEGCAGEAPMHSSQTDGVMPQCRSCVKALDGCIYINDLIQGYDCNGPFK